MEKSYTGRGFKLITFNDTYNLKCSIQQSSSVAKRIWVGAGEDRMHLNRKQSLKVAIKLLKFFVLGKI